MGSTKRLALGLLAASALAFGSAACKTEAGKAGPSDDVGAKPAKEAPGEAPSAAATAEAAPPAGAPAAADRAVGGKGEGAKAKRSAAAEPSPEQRPGLGTEWGEARTSHINQVSFTRGEAAKPHFLASLFYNDEHGAKAMASSAGFRRNASGPIKVGDGAFEVGLHDERGRFLRGFTAADKEYIIGEAGQRYTIIVKNLTDARFEAVVSVDGLDVMDGKPAAVTKRGYIVDPHEELEVDGFRQSTEQVAAFRFGKVSDSYANQKHGDTRNVGVIGVALFPERGANPATWLHGDVEQRKKANPFPGFAAPP